MILNYKWLHIKNEIKVARECLNEVLRVLFVITKEEINGSKSVSARALSCFVRYVEVMMSLYNDI